MSSLYRTREMTNYQYIRYEKYLFNFMLIISEPYNFRN